MPARRERTAPARRERTAPARRERTAPTRRENQAPARRGQAAPAIGLFETQAWLQQEILRPVEGGPGPGEAGRLPLEAMVRRHGALDPADRVRIYQDAYFLRLVGCLRVDFPAVEAVLGEDRFEELCRGYLARYPSRSFTLNPLGWRLPAYVEELAPEELPHRDLVFALARLEATMSEVFDAPGAPPLAPEAIAAVPPGAWATARIRFSPTLRLLTLSHDANRIVTAVRRSEPLPDPVEPRESHVALYRLDHQVWRVDLPPARHALLRALLAGETLETALEAAAPLGDPDALESQVFCWLQDWVQDGLFCGVDL